MTPPWTRRRFLSMVGLTSAAVAVRPLVVGLPAADAQTRAPDPAFPEGIASGDPQPDGAVIWTRVDPSGGPTVTVEWEVAEDDTFAALVASGTTTAVADDDHTVHVAVTGLDADRWYAYRFRSPAGTSRGGRLRTAPAPGAASSHLRFAFCSCQQINASLYNAHTAMADEGIDFFVHYGDYVYVSDTGTQTLEDYRGVYRRFKANDRLQDLHARVPSIVVWDDGEFANGVDRTFPPDRFAAAKRAWFDYMPVARHPEEPDRTYRRVDWGALAAFWLTDLRQYRDPAVDATDTATPEGRVPFEPGRTALGAEQKAWLKEEMVSVPVTWRLLGASYNWLALRLRDDDTPEAREDPPPDFIRNGGNYVENEAMDDYQLERREVLEHLDENDVANVLITSGHTHVYFAGRLQPDFDDAASPVVAREFVCGSLTADPDPREAFFPDLPPEEAEVQLANLGAALVGINPHLDLADLIHQGYAVVDITPERAVVELRVIDTFDAAAVATTSARYEIPVGSLPTRVEEPPPEEPPEEPPAPAAPPAAPIADAATFTG